MAMPVDPNPIKSIRDFLDRTEPLTKGSAHGSLTLFRGQRDAGWPLVPGIARCPFTPADICKNPLDQDDRSKERRLLIVFRDHAPALLPQWVWSGPPAYVRWKQIVVAQHYGLPTRLLDWSTNPLVALFFAMEEAAACPDPEKCPYRSGSDPGECAYRLDVDGLTLSDGRGPSLRFPYASVLFSSRRETTSVESLARRNKRPPLYNGVMENAGNQQGAVSFLRPPDTDGRITAQSSIFSVSADPKAPIEPDGVIWINPTVREEILDHLGVLGISRKTLYPGLEGLTSHLVWDHRRWK